MNKKTKFYLFFVINITIFILFSLLEYYNFKNLIKIDIIFLLIINLLFFFLFYKEFNNEYFIDKLTQFYRREKIEEIFENLKKKYDKIAILFVDLDNFKKVNDTYGHKVGDEVLIEVTKKLKKFFKNYKDVQFFRNGGDEFIIFIPYENNKELEKKLFNLSNELEIRKYNISASIGLVYYPDFSDNIYALIEKADHAMYIKKKEDKNGLIIYNYELEKNLRMKNVISNALREILINKNTDEFSLEVFLQPQKHIKYGTLKGAEALIRMKYSNRLNLYLSPGIFLPIAKESNLTHLIDLFVIEKVCQAISKWLKKGYNFNFPISVNLTFQNLNKKFFIDEVLKIIKKYEIPHEYIGFEITEETIMKNPEEHIKVINYLNSQNFIISLDDFGTGHSNLEYLKIFKADKLKIDKNFVKYLDSSFKEPKYIKEYHQNSVILSSIEILAKSFNIELIAEGVETEGQLEALKEFDIEIIQGFYFDKPMSIEDFEKKFFIENKN